MMANIIMSSMMHVTQTCIICVTFTFASYFTVGAMGVMGVMSVRFLVVFVGVTI